MIINRFCRACGFRQESDDRFCSGCGAAVAESPVRAEVVHPAVENLQQEAPMQTLSTNSAFLKPLIPPGGKKGSHDRTASINPATVAIEKPQIQDIINKVAAPFKNGAVFVVVYLLFLLPTYYLPYAGSNSSVINALGAAVGVGLTPQFWTHIASLFVLIVATWLRSCAIGKQWIVVFPIVASVFDITPGLSIIPLIPTAMHILALIMGARGATSLTPVTQVPIFGAIVACAVGAVIVSGLMYSWTWQSRVNQPVLAVAPKTLSGRPDVVIKSPPQPQNRNKAISQREPSNTAPVEDWVGQWTDGGPGCASINEAQTPNRLVLRTWYCEANQKSATPITLEFDETTEIYVDERTGLSVKFLLNADMRISAPGKIRSLFGDGMYLAEETREFKSVR